MTVMTFINCLMTLTVMKLYDIFFAYSFASKSRDFQDTGRENKKHGGHFSHFLCKNLYFELVSA